MCDGSEEPEGATAVDRLMLTPVPGTGRCPFASASSLCLAFPTVLVA